MGKRSAFARVDRDFYPTPHEAVAPLIPHLDGVTHYIEPCAGDGALIRALSSYGRRAIVAYDIAPRCDCGTFDALTAAVRPQPTIPVITNPPWARDFLHPFLRLWGPVRPLWLLFDADWVHTRQAAEFIPRLSKIVSVGRVKWIADSPHTGKDNCAWHLFEPDHSGAARFYGRCGVAR